MSAYRETYWDQYDFIDEKPLAKYAAPKPDNKTDNELRLKELLDDRWFASPSPFFLLILFFASTQTTQKQTKKVQRTVFHHQTTSRRYDFFRTQRSTSREYHSLPKRHIPLLTNVPSSPLESHLRRYGPLPPTPSLSFPSRRF